MASFSPLWDLKAQTAFIQEGNSVLVALSINKETPGSGDSYTLDPDEFIETTIFIQATDSNGDPISAEEHYELSVGENPNNLTPISTGITGNKLINGKHKIKLTSTSFSLPGSTLSENVYYYSLYCKRDGTYNDSEKITFTLDTVNVNHLGNISASGEVRVYNTSVSYDSSELWVTPGITVGDDNSLYCIGDIDFGSDSTLFVQAFGRKRAFDDDIDNPSSNPNIDTSPRVFYPGYRLMQLTSGELPSQNITDIAAMIQPSSTMWPIAGNNKEISTNIEELNGRITTSGLIFNPNGQFLQTLLFQSDPTDVYFKIQLIDIQQTYSNDTERFAVDQRYKAYQMWISPTDISNIYSENQQLKPNHLYQLKDNIVYPYVIKSTLQNGVTVPIFDSNDWNDLGYYEPSLSTGIVGETKLFRFLMNSSKGNVINIITDPDLGSIHVGEYFGHSVYPKIETTSTVQVSYQLSAGDDITKYGLDLTPDGYLVGKAYALSTDFSANDDIKLNFTISVFDTNGAKASQDFKLKIIRGFGQNYLSAHVVPSVQFEREWFKCISTPSFVNQGLHRQSDNRYGLQKVPRLLLKENLLSQSYNYTNLTDLKRVLRSTIIDTSSGSPVPDGKFKMVIGNYKIISALDNQGNLQYDLLYREVHPAGTAVSVSLNPRVYSNIDNGLLAELFGLRQNLFAAIGEDTTNLITDPNDLKNRGLFVDAIPGLSEEMLDTVPRFMNHPFEESGVVPKFMPIIPVAYCAPGKAEAFFNKLVQNNEHGSMVSTEFEITAVEFEYYEQQFNKYVSSKFQIALQNSNLGG